MKPSVSLSSLHSRWLKQAVGFCMIGVCLLSCERTLSSDSFMKAVKLAPEAVDEAIEMADVRLHGGASLVGKNAPAEINPSYQGREILLDIMGSFQDAVFTTSSIPEQMLFQIQPPVKTLTVEGVIIEVCLG